jgi:hypothetical protein
MACAASFVLRRAFVARLSITMIPLVPLAVFACGPPLPQPPYTPQATNALTPVEFAPPPGRVELIPPRPPKADAWVDGEWIPRHGRWYWLLGRWVKTVPGATYSPWVVVRTSDGDVYYAPGVWKDRNGSPIPPPPALAFATGDAEAVFDAQGEAERTGRNIKSAPLPTAPPGAGARP